MSSLDPGAASQVCRIATDLAANESLILVTSPLHNSQSSHSTSAQSRRTSLLGSALVSLLQTPTQALAHTLFGATASQNDTHSHLHPLQSSVLDPDHDARSSKQAIVWLSWDDCRCLARAFKHFEYVDAQGKPTSLVDTLVSRLTAGEAALTAHRPSGSDAVGIQSQDSGGVDTSSTMGVSGSSGASRLWGWSTSGTDRDGEEASGTHNEEQVRTAAWQLLSNTFARATALRISAEAEEVAESDAQAVLTWFPRLEYLDIQSIPHPALLFWDLWMPNRLTCLKMEYAGLALDKVFGLCTTNEQQQKQQQWSHLVLLDLSRNPGIDLTPLSTTLPHLMPNISRLSLAHCELDSVPGSLVKLYSLSWLDLRGNGITSVTDISLKLGSIVRLDLGGNRIDDVTGLRRLWALETLDISDNRLGSWASVLVLRNMPALASLVVRGNPFALKDGVAYRSQIFSAFDHRDIPLVLDGYGPTRQERREMAKIPRIATGHRIGTTAAAATASVAAATTSAMPLKKAYRPKVAVIEESADVDLESDDGAADRAGSEDAGARGSDAIEAKDASSLPVAGPVIGLLEKSPRGVLRATELMAAHRLHNMPGRYNLPATASSSTSPQLILMKSRPRTKRRATATTIGSPTAASAGGGGGGREPRGVSEQSTAAYFVPSSYGGRPASPAPSSLAPSMRTGASFLRDPEWYRRRVEMMRAEAGSSWLRAFAELQSQSRQTSPASPVIQQGSHFGQSSDDAYGFLSSQNDAPASDSVSIKSDTRDASFPTASTRQNTNGSSGSDLSHDTSDTQLPSFLFPRRKPTVRKKDIPRLPHYSPEEVSQKDQDKASVIGLGIVDEEANSPELPQDKSPQSPSLESGRGSGENSGAHSRSQSQQTSELDRLRKGEDVRAFLAGEVCIAYYGFVPISETPLANDRSLPEGSQVVQRLRTSGRSVFITSDELIDHSDEDGIQTTSRTALALITRVKRTADTSVLVEVKGSRFDSPRWIEYTTAVSGTVDGFAAFADKLQTASKSNSAQGLSEQVYKQAECLRCSWHGFIDQERTAFDVLPDNKQFILLPPPPKELQCPQCKREYLREFYAADEIKQEDPGNGNGDDEGVKPIWKRSFVSRRNRPGSSKGKTKAMAAAESEKIARRARQIAEAREIAQRDIDGLGAAATRGTLPFAEATNAIELFLQLSVFEADGERLKRWVPAGLVRQVYPMTPPGGQPVQGSRPASNNAAVATSAKPPSGSKWGFSSLLGSTAASTAATGDCEKDEQRLEGISDEERRAHVVKSDWRASAALVPAIGEQAVYLALSSHAIYVFSLTWDALGKAMLTGSAEMDLQPEQHLGLVFSISLASLGRIDIGPNRQYLTLHSSLLTLDEGTGKHWGAHKLQQLLATANPAYPVSGCPGDHGALADAKGLEKSASMDGYVAKAGSLRPTRHATRCVALQSRAVSSCVFLIRDRLACSDLLDSLVEIGYETNVLNSGVAGAGSGRLRAINHDVEWAMHHLVQQVFLRPTTFAAIDDDDDDDDDCNGTDRDTGAIDTETAAATVGTSLSKDLVAENHKRALRILRQELFRSRSCKQPGALVDASSGDNVIVDKVTYEFLKLYFCVGCAYPLSRAPDDGSQNVAAASAAAAPSGTTGILPLTL
ncbi:hypothetical protein EV175_004276, partial [Coemansia sp. RSA 1933]